MSCAVVTEVRFSLIVVILSELQSTRLVPELPVHSVVSMSNTEYILFVPCEDVVLIVALGREPLMYELSSSILRPLSVTPVKLQLQYKNVTTSRQSGEFDSVLVFSLK